MTAKQLELKDKLDYTIPYLSEKQLCLIITIAEAFVDSKHSVRKDGSEKKSSMPPRNPKFGGRRISDEVAKLFLTGNSWDVSDEELEQMRYEYLTEKYK